MRILYYFYELDTPMYQWQREHIFDELSHHGIEFITFNPALYKTPEEANNVFIKILSQYKHIDMFFSCVESKWLYNETVMEVKRILSVPTVLICWDNLELPYKQKKIAKVFDLVWLTSRETEYLFKRWGCKTVFASYAANPYSFKPKAQSESTHSIGFIGTPYGSRTNKINTLTSNSIPCEVYSNSLFQSQEVKVARKTDYWDITQKTFRYLRFLIGRNVLFSTIQNQLLSKESTLNENQFLSKRRSLTFQKMIESYSSFTLSLNISELRDTFILRKPIYKIHLRTFEIPMSGGLQLTSFNDEIASYFEEGKEIVLYKSNEELIDKAKFYLSPKNDRLIRQMKKNASLRAKSEHTWFSRFSKVLDQL